MKKHIMWRSDIKSIYGVRSFVLCSDKAKLVSAISSYKEEGFIATEIRKSSYYCTDGDTNLYVHTI